jgi:hypothetical protein
VANRNMPALRRGRSLRIGLAETLAPGMLGDPQFNRSNQR